MVVGEHRVSAYDAAAELVECVADFVEAGLRAGDRVVRIIRPAEAAAVDDLLADRGLDPRRHQREGVLRCLDAETAMRAFMDEGRPDPVRFAALLADTLPRAGRPTWAFGEMVALLWERDEVVAALELEEMWNHAVETHRLRLLCAYPAALLADGALGQVARMCDLHDSVGLLGGHPDAGVALASAGLVVSGVFLPVPASVASVRHFVADALAGWGLHRLVGDAALVTSELATNAVVHGASPFRTSVALVDGAVRVAIEDASASWPQRQQALPGDQDGRGMAIVEALADRVGCDRTPAGKVAWAELGA